MYFISMGSGDPFNVGEMCVIPFDCVVSYYLIRILNFTHFFNVDWKSFENGFFIFKILYF